MADPLAQARHDIAVANRVVSHEDIIDAFGHVSMRHPTKPDRYLISRSRSPEVVEASDIYEYTLDSEPVTPLPNGIRGYGELVIHGEIYKARPDVKAVVHNHSPSVIPFSVTTAPLQPLYHMSAFLGSGVPVFDIKAAAGESTDMLVRTPALGRALAQTLGAKPVALMRGHGAVVVGDSVQIAVFRSIYTEMNAKLQAQAMALGGPVTYLDPEEARKAAANVGGTISRPWELWKQKALGK